jgi:predicted AAA+ superfamily ATPase
MRGVSESLAGRVAVVHLLGLSRLELEGRSEESRPFLPTPDEIQVRTKTARGFSLKELYGLIWRGSFPAIALDNEIDRDLFYGSYVQTYVQRDIRDLSRVGDDMAFLRFTRAAAARTGQMLNMSKLGRDADVATNTAKNWLSILQASGIV